MTTTALALIDADAAVFTVSRAAQLTGLHAQTLRTYDRLGLVVAARTRGGGRRYSARDLERLRLVTHLSRSEGINLEGIARILTLRDEVETLRRHNAELSAELRTRRAHDRRSRGGRSSEGDQGAPDTALTRIFITARDATTVAR